MPTADRAYLAARVTATGELVGTPAHVKSIEIAAGALGGSVILRDGGAGGTTKLTITTAAEATNRRSVQIPGRGMKFSTDVHATLDQATEVIIFYDIE